MPAWLFFLLIVEYKTLQKFIFVFFKVDFCNRIPVFKKPPDKLQTSLKLKQQRMRKQVGCWFEIRVVCLNAIVFIRKENLRFYELLIYGSILI